MCVTVVMVNMIIYYAVCHSVLYYCIYIIYIILQNGVKVFNGTPLPVFSEEDIFKYLDIPYREPKDRDLD